jgi:alpha-beta hydrolase superfamily lysophospholipase
MIAPDHVEGRFTGAGGTQLFRQAWRPRTKPRAALVNLHGLGDHSGLYPLLVNYFVARSYSVHAPDLRGNGRSAGQRGYVGSWPEFREDLDRLLQIVREEEPGCPVFLLGNSLGGLIALDYALHHPAGLSGVIAAAPPLGKLGVPPLLMSLGRVMSRIMPRLSLQVGMDLSGLARDPSVVEAVLADPLFHRRGTARLSTEVTAAIARVQEGASSLSVPLLILHGSDDRMVPPDGSRAFFAKVRHPDREFREYPGAYHGLFADLDHVEVLGDLGRWLDAHIPARTPVT